MNSFHAIGIPLLFAVVFVVLSLVFSWGNKMGALSRERSAKPESYEFVYSTLLGLLALILGFTFSMAISRYENRRTLSVHEANAIGTARLRAELVSQPTSVQVTRQLNEYLEARIKSFEGDWNQRVVDGLERQIWDTINALTKKERGVLEAQLVIALNEMFDVGNARTLAFRYSLPEAVSWVVLLIASAGLWALGYERGQEGMRGLGHSILLSFSFALVFALIHDFDQPRAGMIHISQDALKALRVSK